MTKFLVMVALLYVINKVAYWAEERRQSKQPPTPDPYDPTPNYYTRED